MSQDKTSNQSKAPICAAWVEQMRALFVDVKVLWVKEKDFEIGAPSEPIVRN